MATSSSAQHSLIDFLKRPSSYPHQPGAVKIIQTHASILAMAPPFVYKFKKRFDFGFMDFRTLEARRENCQRELALNRRLCKEVYLEVLPLYSKDGQLSFSPEGTIVDYALKMKQLPDGYFFDQLLEKGQLGTPQLEQLLQRLKTFYEQQPTDPSVSRYAEPSHLRQLTNENFESLGKMENALVSPIALEAIQRETNDFYRRSGALFEKRIAEGRIRDCHGDLHLDHVHLQEGRLCIFDCLEFNDRFRYTDIAADIAFLAMDLDFSASPVLAQFVAERMAELLQDRDMLLLMDFYKSYRACVRAKVEGIRASQAAVAEEEKKRGSEKVKRYLQLALKYSITGAAPAVIIVCGRIGSGKSTLARQLASLLGGSYLSSDRCRKKIAGLPLYERPDPEKRAHLYSEQQTEEVYRQLLSQTLEELQDRHTVIVDATFGKKTYRQAFMQAFEKKKVFYCFAECHASEQTLKARLKKRETQTAISDARLEDFSSLIKAFEPLSEIPAAQYIKTATEKAPEESLSILLKALAALHRSFGSVEK